MATKKLAKRKMMKIGFLCIFLAFNVFILSESMIPADQSTQTSMSWANFFASIAEVFGSDKVKVIEPQTVEITGFETVILGESKRLTGKVLPETTTDKSIFWESSDASVAEVTSGGIVVAKSLGAFRVTATASRESVSSYIDLTVVNYPLPESFSISTEKDDIFIGTTTTLDINDLLPEKASKKEITWSSSASSVASVNSYGVVKGLSEGITNIQATSGLFSTSIDISVTSSPTPIIEPSMINIVGDSTGYVYRYTQLTADFGAFPPTDTSVTWLSSDENIAQVDKTGNVYGTKFEGIVTITAISNSGVNIYDTLQMTIGKVSPENLTISASSLSAIAGNTIKLTPTFFPIDVTSKEINWSSSNESVATVSSQGDYAQVTGLKSGTVTIFAVSKMDEEVFAQITLEILKPPVLTPDDRALLNNFIRKALGHYALFFVDGVMAFVLFDIFWTFQSNWKKILVSCSIGTFVAALSEVLQLFTKGRTGKLLDVFIDCLGFFTAFFFTLLVLFLYRKRKDKKKTKPV